MNIYLQVKKLSGRCIFHMSKQVSTMLHKNKEKEEIHNDNILFCKN